MESQEFLKKLKECLKEYNFGLLFNNFIREIEYFCELKKYEAEALLEHNDNDIEKTFKLILEEYKTLVTDFQTKIKNKYDEFIEKVENMYKLLVDVLEYDNIKETKNKNLETNVDVKAPIGTLFGKVGLYAATWAELTAVSSLFPPLFLATLSASVIVRWYFGKSIGKTLREIFSKRDRLIESLENLKKSQVDEFNLMKERFVRDFEQKKEILENDSTSIINIRLLELSNKSKDTKQFYAQIKKDYENLYNIIKIKFNL